MTPYTSPHCLLSEPITGASPKPSINIVHPPPRSSRRRAAPVDLRCRLHFDENRTSALLLPDLQVDASELSLGRTPASPSASKKRCRAAPSATSSVPDPLGEPCHHPSYPATSPHRSHTHAADRAAREPPASLSRPRNSADSGTDQSGHRRMAMGRVNMPLPGLGPSREQATAPNRVQPCAESRLGTVHPIFGFSISFTFPKF
jgi:hypothetical protein